MGLIDKAKNAVDEAAGKAKETVGQLTDNERLERRARPSIPRPTPSRPARTSRTSSRLTLS